MPMGILEALSYGLPCIVTEGTTLADFVKENGAGITCPTNAAAIGEALKQAIASRESFAEMSQRGREAVCRDFAWERIADGAVKKYAELAEK
jgi:glycosyltransferase involved in cell wall biosynthesis